MGSAGTPGAAARMQCSGWHLLVLGLATIAVAELAKEEGSGGLLGDSEDLDEDLDGSGEFIEDLQNLRSHKVLQVVPDKADSDDFDFTIGREEDDYYDDDDNYEFYENYIYAELDSRSELENSILKVTKDEEQTIERKPDIEIKPKPPSMEDDILPDTSEILIMVGSAFISFGVVMLVFFICRQRLEQSKEKAMPYTIPTRHTAASSSPIVKDYQRVPTTTQEFLAAPHIEMYRGEGKADPLLPSSRL